MQEPNRQWLFQPALLSNCMKELKEVFMLKQDDASVTEHPTKTRENCGNEGVGNLIASIVCLAMLPFNLNRKDKEMFVLATKIFR